MPELIGPKHPVPTAPASEFNLTSPSPTGGFRAGRAEGRANEPSPGFTPRAGESDEASRQRVTDAARSVARRAGAEPADLG